MYNRSDFNREKISGLRPVRGRAHIDGAEYDEKDTRPGKLLKNTAVRRGFQQKTRVFRPAFEQRDGQLTVTCAISVENVIQAILY
jgi:hypothetical protein